MLFDARRQVFMLSMAWHVVKIDKSRAGIDLYNRLSGAKKIWLRTDISLFLSNSNSRVVLLLSYNCSVIVDSYILNPRDSSLYIIRYLLVFSQHMNCCFAWLLSLARQINILEIKNNAYIDLYNHFPLQRISDSQDWYSIVFIQQ